MTSHVIVSATDQPVVLSSVSGYLTDNETVQSNVWHAVVVIAYTSVIVVSVAGNGIVVLSVVTCRRMRTVTNYFIVSLAGADLMMAVLCVPFTFIANWLVDRWPFGAAMCPVVLYLQTVSVFLSAFTLVGLVAKNGLNCLHGWPRLASNVTLVGLSVDRFRAVVFPLRPRVTARQVLSAIAVIWLLALSFPLPVAIFSRVDEVSGLCEETWSDVWKLVYSVSVLSLHYFVPLLILTVCYSAVCYVIWIKKTPGEAENARDARRALSKRKVTRRQFTSATPPGDIM